MNRFFLQLILIFFLAFFSPMVFSQSCGDGTCDAGENTCTCAQDCGSCSSQAAGACRQYSCIENVCAQTFILNCCGNRVCEGQETFFSCQVDCSPQRIKIEILDFDDSVEYLLAEEVFFKVKVLADDQLGTQAKVTANGFFGSITLFDDGEHGDKNSNDGVYANSFLINEKVEKNDYTIIIEAEKDGTIGTKTIVLNVNPFLEIDFEVEGDSFVLGDIITLGGTVSRKGELLDVPVLIEFVVRQKSIYRETIESDNNGYFNFVKHTSLVDPAGDWTIFVSAFDENFNKGLVEKEVFVSDALGKGYFSVEFIEPIKKSFNRGDNIEILVRVLDEKGNPVEKAKVEGSFLNLNSVELTEVSLGNYRGKLEIPFDSDLGEQNLISTVSKPQKNVEVTGYNSTIIFINMAGILIETLSPEETIFKLGETINFRFKIKYESNIPLLGAKTFLHIGEKAVDLKDEGGGFYSGTFKVPDEFGDNVVFNLEVEDEFANEINKELQIVIKQEFPAFYFITGNTFLFAFLIVFILFALIVIGIFGVNILRLRYLYYKKEQLIESKTKLQDDYFNKAKVKSSDYYSMVEKYNHEIGEVEIAINIIKEK